MSDLVQPKVEQSDRSLNESQIHKFRPLTPDSRENSQPVQVVENEAKIYQKTEAELIQQQDSSQKIEKSTIFGSAFMITNLCLGTTIFTFAVRAKAFGLIWFLVFCVIVGAINYWSIMRCVYASSRCKVDDYSEITEKIMGKKMRITLNVFLIIYSYGFMMCFLSLMYILLGRFIHSAGYTEDYPDFSNFNDKIWGKAYIKYPIFIGICFCLSLMCLIKDINKLNFSAYIGVIAVVYSLFVVMIECDSYYKHYKKTVYIEEDKSTHPNWINLGDAFDKKLSFFIGLSSLFAAYSCHPGVFPIYAGFKFQENGLNKMKWGTFLGTLLTTILHIISITCSFLTDPYSPEDLIVYRKNKGNGKDIAMVIAKLFVSLSLIFTYPGYFFALRLSIANSFTGGQINNKFNYLFTFLSTFGCGIVAAVYDKILNYLSYIGGFLSVFICYMFPTLLCIYSSEKPFTYWKNLLQLILATFLCILGIMAGILTIIDDVSG